MNYNPPPRDPWNKPPLHEPGDKFVAIMAALISAFVVAWLT